MSLLRAARGGVIEDLTVDWGLQDPPPNKEEKYFDDDFEMISDETASAEPPAPAPISLFDTSTPSTSEDLGPKKMIINLAPPPRIQQAPKSDKLPIPLYPGFRCSIFSIIKVSGQTSFSSCVRIHGKVMGSPVTLEIPVMPIALEGGAATHLTDAKVKLLHSLAARALIQDWEDKEKTEKNRAEVERLGKRYSLASSATSFLAIDDDTKKEVEKEEIHFQEPEREVERSLGPLTQQRRSVVLSAQPTGFSKQHGAVHIASAAFTPGSASRSRAGGSLQLLSSAAPAPPPPPSYDPAPPQARGSFATLMRLGGMGSTRSAPAPTQAPGSVATPMQLGGLMGSYASSTRSDDLPRTMQSALPQRFERRRADSGDGGGGAMDSSRSHRASARAVNFSAQVSGAALPTPAPVPTSAPYGGTPAPASYGGTLTVESIARAQQFGGGFPVSSDFIRLLTGSSSAPPLPSELAVLSGSVQVKQIIWVTVLVLAVLAKKFAGDKDSWEMLAEKSCEFVETSLVSMGVDSGNVVMVTNQLKTAAARNV